MNIRAVAEKFADSVQYQGKSFLLQSDRDACVEMAIAILKQETGENAPKRRWEATIKVGGDTKPALLALLTEFSERIDEASGKSGCAHGGVSAGGSFDLAYDSGQTHDGYVAQLHAYLEKAKEKI